MAATGPVVEERRVLTLLAADLVGSTALGELLDPEEARLVVGGAVARMVAAVEELGGTVKDLAGDGIFCLFGAPLAHEDDPERAVRAGLKIAETIAAYAEEVEHGWSVRGFGVRVGIATGTVVVGPIGAGGRVEYGATGDAANTAARLQAAAEPATVLVDETTRRLVEPLFAWGEPRALQLKGKERPVLATPALSPLAASPPRRPDTPLVGRERELAVARDALADVLAGTGGVLFVTGEPGIGKSRLLAELRRELASAASVGGRPLWLEGRAASYSDTVPYAPFRDLLRSWLELPAGQPELRARVALRRALEALFGVEAASLEPPLAVLLGLEVEEASLAARPQDVRRRVVEAVETLLARLACDGPVVVALDDVQWADASSLELVEHLLGLPDREPVLLALAHRVELAHPSWELRERALRLVPHRTRELSLAPLPEEADAELLSALVGRDAIPQELSARLLAAAAGNPFFLEELVHSLRDAGALVPAEGRWRLDGEVEFVLPESVQSVVVARLDRLPASARALLGAASVLGRRFPLTLLEALAETEIDEPLLELQRLDLLRESRRWPEREFSFKHPLIQEAVYRSLVRARRRELHARAADALLALVGEGVEEHAAVLARHTLEAGRLEQALAWFRSAGDAAARVYASEEALEQYRQALELAQQLGETDAVLELRLARGRVAYRAGRLDAARADYEDAVVLARAAGLRGFELQALEEIGWCLLVGGARIRDTIARLEDALAIARELGDETASARIQSRLAIVHAHALRFAEADGYSRAALELARTTDDERLRATALDSVKTVAVYLGDFVTLRAIQEELGDLLRRVADSWYLQWMLFESALPLMAEGRFEQADAAIGEALELNRRIGDHATEPYFVAVRGWLHRAAGAYQRALDLGRRAAELAAELGHRSSWLVWSETQLGQTLVELGAYDEAAARLRRGLEQAEGRAGPLYVFRCAAWLAVAELAAGDSAAASLASARAERMLQGLSTPPGRVFLHGADALLAVATLRAHAGATAQARELAAPLVAAAERSRWHEPLAAGSRLLARLLLEESDLDGAERHLRAALAAAREGGLPGEQLRAHAALGVLLARRGEEPEAAQHQREQAARLGAELAAGIDEPVLRRSFLETVVSAEGPSWGLTPLSG